MFLWHKWDQFDSDLARTNLVGISGGSRKEVCKLGVEWEWTYFQVKCVCAVWAWRECGGVWVVRLHPAYLLPKTGYQVPPKTSPILLSLKYSTRSPTHITTKPTPHHINFYPKCKSTPTHSTPPFAPSTAHQIQFQNIDWTYSSS